MYCDFKGISLTKYFFIKDFIKGENIKFSPFSNKSLVWGGDRYQPDDILVEDGFIRSSGLGVMCIKPYSVIFDRIGMYFDATKPSELENILNNISLKESDTLRAMSLIEKIVSCNISKYNHGEESSLDIPTGRKVILVPGQVESDASIRLGSPVIKTNNALLEQVRKSNKDAFIIYKPHPDVTLGERDSGNWKGFSKDIPDMVVTNASITSLFEYVDEVHTMTSLAGFEALLRRKKVFTYGMPFYAGWGLTNDMLTCERRCRMLSLEELLFGSLIKYPRYIDPATKKLCSVEVVIDRLNLERSMALQGNQLSRCLLLAKRLRNKVKNDKT